MRSPEQGLVIYVAVFPEIADHRRREVPVAKDDVEVIAVVPVTAFHQVDVIKGPALPAPEPGEEGPPDLAHILKLLRQGFRVKAEVIPGPLEAEQSQPQFQPVHLGPADGGVPGRAEDFVLLRPFIEAVIWTEPGTQGPALLHQGPRPLSRAVPDRSAHGFGLRFSSPQRAGSLRQGFRQRSRFRSTQSAQQ